jgi:hypothetical protein
MEHRGTRHSECIGEAQIDPKPRSLTKRGLGVLTQYVPTWFPALASPVGAQEQAWIHVEEPYEQPVLLDAAVLGVSRVGEPDEIREPVATPLVAQERNAIRLAVQVRDGTQRAKLVRGATRHAVLAQDETPYELWKLSAALFSASLLERYEFARVFLLQRVLPFSTNLAVIPSVMVLSWIQARFSIRFVLEYFAIQQQKARFASPLASVLLCDLLGPCARVHCGIPHCAWSFLSVQFGPLFLPSSLRVLPTRAQGAPLRQYFARLPLVSLPPVCGAVRRLLLRRKCGPLARPECAVAAQKWPLCVAHSSLFFPPPWDRDGFR